MCSVVGRTTRSSAALDFGSTRRRKVKSGGQECPHPTRADARAHYFRLPVSKFLLDTHRIPIIINE